MTITLTDGGDQYRAAVRAAWQHPEYLAYEARGYRIASEEAA